MPKKAVNALLADVENKLGMEAGGLKLDADNQSFVQIEDDGVVLAFDYLSDQDRLVISAMLDHPPAGSEAAVHAALLQANYAWQDTFGATLSLAPEDQQPVLMHQMRVEDVTAKEFIALVEGTADLAAYFNDVIAGAGDGTAVGEEAADLGMENLIRG